MRRRRGGRRGRPAEAAEVLPHWPHEIADLMTEAKKLRDLAREYVSKGTKKCDPADVGSLKRKLDAWGNDYLDRAEAYRLDMETMWEKEAARFTAAAVERSPEQYAQVAAGWLVSRKEWLAGRYLLLALTVLDACDEAPARYLRVAAAFVDEAARQTAEAGLLRVPRPRA